jgi:hypothetical protein
MPMGLVPAIPAGSVAACNCFFRNAGTAGDGQNKPGHHGSGRRSSMSILSRQYFRCNPFSA